MEGQIRRVSEAKRLRSLEDENAKLKRLLADAMLDNVALKDLLGKKWWCLRGSGKLSLIWWKPTRWANGGRVTRANDARLRQRMKAIAHERRRFGYHDDDRAVGDVAGQMNDVLV
jgi:hypothetical protein